MVLLGALVGAATGGRARAELLAALPSWEPLRMTSRGNTERVMGVAGAGMVLGAAGDECLRQPCRPALPASADAVAKTLTDSAGNSLDNRDSLPLLAGLL